MKNKEKYVDVLAKCASDRYISFGVDKETGEPKMCGSVNDSIICGECAFYGEVDCSSGRTRWLEAEADKWADFRDLKKGDVVFIKCGTLWMPVIFISLECGTLFYMLVADEDRKIFDRCHEDDPSRVRKDISHIELY